MITDQLLDYIKQQLSRGLEYDAISKELLNNGWEKRDIQEGFIAIRTHNTNLTKDSNIYNNIDIKTSSDSRRKLSKRMLLIIGSMLVLVSGTSGYYFRNDLPVIKDLSNRNSASISEIQDQDNIKSEIKQEETLPLTEELEQNQDINQSAIKDEPELIKNVEDIKVAVVDNTKVTPPVRTGPINCGTEMKCFIAAAKNCAPAFVEETQTLDIFGIYSQTNKTKMTLTGYDLAKRCGYISKVITANVDYGAEIKSSPEYIAATDEEKKADLAEVSDSVKITIGMTTKCSFTTTYLSAILAKWSKGEYSSEDYKPGNCTTTDSAGNVYPML